MNDSLDDLKHIRSMMERSTKFLSLSGMSGIVAGIAALVGGWFVYLIVYLHSFRITSSPMLDVFIIAVIVLLIALSGGFYFSWKKAKQSKQQLWSSVTKQIILDAGLPLSIGGIFSLILVYHDVASLTASSMLIFCGMACINAGARSYRDVKILGSGLILLGLCAGVWTNLALLFWVLGFGFLFIIYGIVVHHKYDVVSSK